MTYEQPKQQLEFEADLMTAQQYAELGGHVRPYIYEVADEGATIHYVGFGHSNDPENAQFKTVEHDYASFNPDLVVVEGINNLENRQAEMEDLLRDNSKEEIIRRSGETGLAAKLAFDQGIDYVSPEPHFDDEIAFLLQRGFSQEDIIAAYIARQITGFQRKERRGTFETEMESQIKELASGLKLDHIDLGQALSRIEEITGKPLDLEDAELYRHLSDPIPWPDKDNFGVTNQIAQVSALYRDNHMMQRLKEYKEKYKRIFIVFGASHAVMQEPAIRKMMKE
jgi:hypothetical protein